MFYSHKEILDRCTEQAIKSTCGRSKCGSVIISDDGEIIGQGYNSPAGNETHRCGTDKSIYNSKVTDKTCCVHAEQRAMLDAIKNNNERIIGSTLYFIRLDESGEATPSGRPYCTICSKMALDMGIKSFALFHDLEIPTRYNTQDYNNISYEYSN